MKGPAGVSVTALSKRYTTPSGPITALDTVSLNVQSGASLAITGPSGCGKSTLLAIMCGLEEPTMGRVLIDGIDITRLSARERARLRRDEFGLVFQQDNLLPFLTAIENVTLQQQMQGHGKDYGSCLHLLGELGLRDKVGKLPDQLSGGERQRVAVACALIKSPSVILADEPTGALDSENSSVVIDHILNFHRRVNATLVVVTHDIGVAARMGAVVGMRDGTLVSPHRHDAEADA
jgi:ABC-type lipoprotein export system ATPase subunit